MRQSEQINDLAAALAKAQGAMDHASKDRTNPAFKSRYADLASVVDACRPALSSNGIAVVQPARLVGGAVEVDTVLVHQTGQWIAETLCANVPDTKAQTIGSAITYLRRYGLSSMVGVAPDDDDGNGATRPQQREERPAPHVAPAPAPESGPSRADVAAALAKALAAFPEHAAELTETADSAPSPQEALVRLRRVYTRLAGQKTSAPKLPQRDASGAQQETRIRQVLAVLERDGKSEALGKARALLAEYGGELAERGVSNAELGACLSQIEAIANVALGVAA